MLLHVSRDVGETLVIDNEIKITVDDIDQKAGIVRFKIESPNSICIVRLESIDLEDREYIGDAKNDPQVIALPSN